MEKASKKTSHWEHKLGLLGVALFLVGSAIGLFVSPSERAMGETHRIIFIHVPCAWASMVCYTSAFVAAVGSLWSSRRKWDAALTGMIEAGIVLNALLLVQGSIWARTTWGVWWDWDVRLTTSLVMLLLFAGVLALRSFIDEPERRAAWSAIATIVSYVDVPLVFFCVRWWRGLHQTQSSPATVDVMIAVPVQINAIAIIFIATWFMVRRARLELLRQHQEEIDEPERRELLHA